MTDPRPCYAYLGKGITCGAMVEFEAPNRRTCLRCQANVDAAIARWRAEWRAKR